MILLCEDGSLRIYMANVDNTNFWLSPYLQPQSPISVLKPVKKKKVMKSGRPTGSVNFPIDFFEHCLQSNDIEVSAKMASHAFHFHTCFSVAAGKVGEFACSCVGQCPPSG